MVSVSLLRAVLYLRARRASAVVSWERNAGSLQRGSRAARGAVGTGRRSLRVGWWGGSRAGRGSESNREELVTEIYHSNLI